MANDRNEEINQWLVEFKERFNLRTKNEREEKRTAGLYRGRQSYALHDDVFLFCA